MFNLEQLIEIDKYLLLALNGSDSLFWDGCFTVYTTTIVWIPLAIMLLYVLIKNNNINTFLVLAVVIAMVFVLTDGITSTICKPFFERFRPTQDPDLMYNVDIVNGYRGGRYGFISSHAANTFAVAIFVSLLIKDKILSFILLIWALLNSYSRIYLGVHYCGDILFGIIDGCLVGLGIYVLYRMVRKRYFGFNCYVSNKYTKGCYLKSDVHLLQAAFILTCIIIVLWGMMCASILYL